MTKSIKVEWTWQDVASVMDEHYALVGKDRGPVTRKEAEALIKKIRRQVVEVIDEYGLQIIEVFFRQQ